MNWNQMIIIIGSTEESRVEKASDKEREAALQD
jgi:hypothetical protein